MTKKNQEVKKRDRKNIERINKAGDRTKEEESNKKKKVKQFHSER